MSLRMFREIHNSCVLYVTINFNYGTIYFGTALRSQISKRYSHGWFGYDRDKKVIGIKLLTMPNEYSSSLKGLRFLACSRALEYFGIKAKGTLRCKATYSKKHRTIYIYLKETEN